MIYIERFYVEEIEYILFFIGEVVRGGVIIVIVGVFCLEVFS